jgi:predicted YcjX-like family ATPase
MSNGRITIESITDTPILVEMDGDNIYRAWFDVDGEYEVEIPLMEKEFTALSDRLQEAVEDYFQRKLESLREMDWEDNR